MFNLKVYVQFLSLHSLFLLVIMATISQSPSPSLELAGDNYNVKQKIGEGGQGIILKAESRDKPGQFVAVKKMRNASDSNGISIDTIREIFTLRELNHENVIINLSNTNDYLICSYKFL